MANAPRTRFLPTAWQRNTRQQAHGRDRRLANERPPPFQALQLFLQNLTTPPQRPLRWWLLPDPHGSKELQDCRAAFLVTSANRPAMLHFRLLPPVSCFALAYIACCWRRHLTHALERCSLVCGPRWHPPAHTVLQPLDPHHMSDTSRFCCKRCVRVGFQLPTVQGVCSWSKFVAVPVIPPRFASPILLLR